MQNNNWLVWMFVLFFGWSIAGGIASVLITQLGFPYTWISPLTLAMLGTVLFLVYRGYAAPAWLLAGCVGFIIIAAMAILRGITVSEPNIPPLYLREFEAANQDSTFLGYDFYFYDSYAGDYYIEYEADRSEYLVEPGYESRTLITFAFPTQQTPGGQWAFVSGTVRLRGALNATFEADPRYNWLHVDEIMFQADQSPATAVPELTVELPLPITVTRQPIEAHATLTIAVPDETGIPQQQTLTRDLTLNIIGNDFYLYWDDYSNWKRSRSVIETPIWLALVAGCALAGAGGVYLVQQGALQRRSAGGLQLVIRRLSGTQKLGTDFHDPKDFEGAPAVDQGVFIGRVLAQSPAGRAGLRTGDVLLELDGKTTSSPRVARRIANGLKKGQQVRAVVLRHGERIELVIRF